MTAGFHRRIIIIVALSRS